MRDGWLHDVKQGLRLLHRGRAVSVTSVIVLALGIGASTALYTVLDSVLMEPLPYPDSGRIMSVDIRFTGIGSPDDRVQMSPPEFMDLRRFEDSFSASTAYVSLGYNVRVGELPERISGAAATPEFFGVLGVTPQIGRAFAAEEGEPGNDNVVVLGHAVWQRAFGADPRVIGRSINVNGSPSTVIGVMPEGFDFPAGAELWAPLAFSNEQLSPRFRGFHYLRVLGRLRPEIGIEQARADMERVSAQIIEGAPEYEYVELDFAVLVRPLLEDFVGDIRPALMLLAAAVAFVLLIACANVANLMLVRATGRAREIGVRTALGATRQRLIRQLLAESLMLAAVAAAVGLGIASFIIRLTAGLGSRTFPRLEEAGVDFSVLGFTALVAVGTALAFGIVPALQASQLTTYDSLKEGARSLGSGHAKQRLRRVFVTGQIALSLVLLCGAGLLIKSFVKLQEVDPGFRPEGVVTMKVDLPRERYRDAELIRGFVDDLIRRIDVRPGVQSVGATSALPLSDMGFSGTITVDSDAVSFEATTPEADLRMVTPDYFEAMGTELVLGRFFDETDREASEPVAIIDETLARTYWPNESPIGQRVAQGGRPRLGERAQERPWRQVVGVVRHTRYRTLEAQSRVQMYLPFAQAPQPAMGIAIRSEIDPAALANDIQRAVAAIDADQPIYDVRPMSRLVADSVGRRELVLLLMASLANIALALAAVGIYGVVSYTVALRSHEIAIRFAMGATRRNVLDMVIGQSFRVIGLGVLVGLAVALLLTRLMSEQLFDVAPTDIPNLAVMSTALMAVALCASAVPAIRASRIAPAAALREE
jgi:putative ABC transport system permease protein